MSRKRNLLRGRAAGVYVRMLSKPQLFIEGNHRTGALVMSSILLRAGQPPFVLSVENAAAYFEPSAVIRDIHKHSPGVAVPRAGDPPAAGRPPA